MVRSKVNRTENMRDALARFPHFKRYVATVIAEMGEPVFHTGLDRNMKNWFKESEVFYEENSDKFSFGSQIHKSPESILRTGMSIVLIGINETIADAIRR